MTGRQRPWRALAVALGSTLAGLAVAGTTGVLAAPATVVSVLVILLAASLIGSHWSQASFGLANTVTLMRVVGTSWAAGLATQAFTGELSRPGHVTLVVIGTTCLLLDGVDGRVARVRGEVSAFGARFDMETDAALLMCLSVTVSALALVGWWVLAIGGMRYLYVASSWVVPALRIRLYFSYRRKVVAVVQGVALLLTLTLGLVPDVPRWPSDALLGMALGSLCWSFGRDVVWQLRRA